MYSQTTAIVLSVLLFISMFIAFIMQMAGFRMEFRSDRYDFFAFDDPGTEMLIIEVFALLYSFGFVLWQSQISYFFFHYSDDLYRLLVGICLTLALIWSFALISSLVAYTYNALLLFFLFANMLQSLLVSYALFQLKNQHDQYSNNVPTPQQQQNQLQENANLLEELRIIRHKLEQNERENQNQFTTLNHDPIQASTDFSQYHRPTKVSSFKS